MKRKFSLEQIKAGTEDYFCMCDGINSAGQGIVKPYTLSGLLFHLGLTRKEYYKLLENKKFSPVLLSASARIEAFIEENILTGELSVNAGANSLKYNFGWGDKKTDKGEGSSDDVRVSLSPDIVNLAK